MLVLVHDTTVLIGAFSSAGQPTAAQNFFLFLLQKARVCYPDHRVNSQSFTIQHAFPFVHEHVHVYVYVYVYAHPSLP